MIDRGLIGEMRLMDTGLKASNNMVNSNMSVNKVTSEACDKVDVEKHKYNVKSREQDHLKDDMQYLVSFCWVEADGKRTLFAHLNVSHKGMYQVVDVNQCAWFASNGAVINWGVKINHRFKLWLNPNLHTTWTSNPTGFLKHSGV